MTKTKAETTAQTMLRTSAMVVVLAIVALVGGACSGGAEPGKTVPTDASGSSAPADALTFAKCMRDNGLPDFKDPEVGKGMGDGVDTNSEVFKKAMNTCKGLMPAGTVTADPGQVWSSADKLKYAKCMRDNGVPNFPDPDSNGGFALSTDPNTPQFKAAATACAKYQPEGLRQPSGQQPGGTGS
jgi:hypothetical protein